MGKQNEHLYPIFVTLLVMLGSVGYLNDIYNWGMNEAVLILLLFFAVVLIHMCYMLRKQPVLYIVLSMLLLLEAVYLLVEKDSLFEEPGRVEILLRAAGILMAVVISYVATRWYIGKLVFLVGFLIMLVVEGTDQRMVSKISISAMLVFCILAFGEGMVAKTFGRKNKQKQQVLSSLLYLYIGAFLVLCIIPVSENRFEWSYVRGAIKSVSTSLSELFANIKGDGVQTDGEYSVSMTGYSTDGKVGGTIINQDKTVLSISSAEPILHSIYLVGNVKNLYKDNEWTESVSDGYQDWEDSDQQMDTLELIYSLYRYNRIGVTEPYLNKENVTITYEDMETTSIFHMLKTCNLGIDHVRTSYNNVLNPVFEDVAEDGFSYPLEYYYLNYDSRSFYDFVTTEEGYEYNNETVVSSSDIKNRVGKSGQLRYIRVSDSLEKVLLTRRQWIYDNYTAVPESISDGVYELTEEITKEYDSNYGKLIAIEAYLHKYTYKKAVSEIPEGNELVDYFLFESKEGYCTYYATAMAMMARTIGIPTRYVQGFLVTVNESGQKNIQVNAMDAHAWVEAYVDGVGWLSFEPTAGCQRDKYGLLRATAEEETIEEEEDIKIKESISNNSIKGAGTMVFVVVGICIISGIVVLIVRINRNKRRYARLSLTDRLYFQVETQLMLLKHLGFTMGKSETWSDFIHRVAKANQEMEEELCKEISVYETVRYSEEEATLNQLDIFIHMNKNIMVNIKIKCSKMSYLFIIIKTELKRV